MLSNKCLVVSHISPSEPKNYLPILNFSVGGLKMYVAIALRPSCLFSHSKYLDSSLLVFSLWMVNITVEED